MSERSLSKSTKENIPKEKPIKDGIFSRLARWSRHKAFNPIIIGNPGMSLRMHSFFVTSPLIDYFDHTALFDDYSEKNLLILWGPLSEIQKDKCKKIKNVMQPSFKTVYLESPFTEQIDEEIREKEIREEFNFLDIDKVLISSFITYDQMTNIIRELSNEA
jgi:hypothetical protein